MYPKFSFFIYIFILEIAYSQLNGVSTTSQPNNFYSSLIFPKLAAWCNNFLGIQPTLTQVPPNPHLVPYKEGYTKSASPTFLLKVDACFAEARPPEPPPITK